MNRIKKQIQDKIHLQKGNEFIININKCHF